MSHTETAPEGLSEVFAGATIALFDANLREALDGFIGALGRHPLVQDIVVAIDPAGDKEGFETRHGRGKAGAPPPLPSHVAEGPVTVVQGADRWLMFPLTAEEASGRMAVKLLADTSPHEVTSLTSVLRAAARLVTHRLRSQASLAELQEGVLLADVLSSLSHDLRISLTCIKGYATLLLDQGDKLTAEERSESLSVMVDECGHIERLISSLLERGEDEAFRVRREPVLIGPAIRRICRDPGLLSGGHRFVVAVPDEVREVQADPVQFEQVMRNLIDNAVKYSPEQSLVVIRARRSKGDVIISISDQGHGIAPEHLNRLFERFFRIQNEESRHVKGTGLGLPIARRIMEAHGGRIWAESHVGRGATFFLSFPSGEDQ